MKPEETIDFHLRWLWQKTMRLYNVEAGKFGGSMSVGYILLNIDKEGTPSTKLGPKMGMESRSLTRTLKSMEEKGLIYRSQNEKDGRSILIKLTTEGKNYRETARKVVIRLNEFLRENIEPKKLDIFMEVAQSMNKLLDNGCIFTRIEKSSSQLNPPSKL